MTAPALLAVAAVALVALARLGSQPLRLDEARTALLGDAVLRTGLPRVRLDRPLLFPASEVSRSGLCLLHTPLQFYVGAVGRLLGGGPAAARLPFTLVGVAGVAGAAALGEHLVEGAGVWTVLAFAQVPVLLLLRQARYYPLVTALTVLALWGVVLGSWWLAALAGVLLALAEWSGFLATLSAAVVAALLGVWPLAPALGLAAGLGALVPWALARRGLVRPVPTHRHLVDGVLESFWTYWWKLHAHLVPLLPLGLAALVAGAEVPLVAAGLWWLVLAHVGLRSLSPALFTRYLAGAVAPAALLAGLLLAATAQHSLAAAAVLGVLLVGSDVLHRLPLWLLPPGLARRLAFVRSPGASHLGREAPEDAAHRPRALALAFLRELASPPRLRAAALADVLPPGSRVLLGHTEAPTLQVAAPQVEVVPWGLHRVRELAWLRKHPPDWVVLGDLDRPAAAAARLDLQFRREVIGAPDVLLANGETLERHLFTDRGLPHGVEVLRRC